MTDIAIVQVSFADRAEADRVAQALIEERLAACASLSDATSIYHWQGEVERAAEVILTIKTTTMLARRAAERIAALHSYTLPVIERWAVSVDDAVAQWVAESTG